MKYSFPSIFSILFLLIFFTSTGQKQYVLPQIAPKSPNVAGFEKYGDIPVSMNTGVPDISIPLTQITVDGLTIPITLTYHNTGLKVQDIASWVGLGWDLKSGGMISWQQQGVSDFDAGHNGLYYSTASLDSYLAGTMNLTQKYRYLEGIINEEEDAEFDKFYLNFLNYSNSFYFDRQHEPRLMPKSDLKISRTASGLKVIDLSGNQFFFETIEAGSMYDAAEVYVRPSASSAAYYLTTIITRNGRQVNFTYKSYALQYNKTNSIKKYTPSQSYPSCPPAGSSPATSDTYIYQTYLLPDKILFDEGTVEFIHSTQNRMDLTLFNTSGIPSLAGIKLTNNNGKIINQFSFTMGYFGNNDRLKLLSIQEQIGSVSGRKWSFHYVDETNTFPGFFSNSKDHWGYYNGKDNGSLFPKADYWNLTASHIALGDADRTSDFRFSKLGLLSTIQYPTGGKTTFEYEPNQIKVKNVQDILQYPFLQWPENSFPVTTSPISGGSTIDHIYSGSFTITETTIANFRAFVELDPSHLSDAFLNFTGPQDGINALYHVMNTSCTTASCQGWADVTLPPGNYSFTLTEGYDYDHSKPLHANFDLNKKLFDYGNIPPFEAGGARIKSITSTDDMANSPDMVKSYVYDDQMDHVIFRNIPSYITSFQLKTNNEMPYLVCFDCGYQFTISSENVVPTAGSNIEYKYVTELNGVQGMGGKTDYEFMTSTNEAGSIYSQPFIAPLNTSWHSGNVLSQKTYKYEAGQYTLLEQINNHYITSNWLNLTNGIRVEYAEYCPMSIDNPPTRIHRTGLNTLFTEQFYQDQSIKKEYFNGVVENTVNTAFQSTQHVLPTIVEKFDSKGQSIREKTVYPLDYLNLSVASSSDALGIKRLSDFNIFYPIETIQIKNISGQDYVMSGTINTFKNNSTLLSKTYALKIKEPLLLSSFVASTINDSGVFIMDPHYEERIVYSLYDGKGNVLEVSKKDDQPVAYLYDYQQIYPIAEIVNAGSQAVAYTSFEADGSGNWTLPNTTRSPGGITGMKCYELSSGTVSRFALDISSSYTVSYWTNSGGPVTVTGTTGTPVLSRTKGAWKCYTHTITGVSQTNISGTGLIDELRLYPTNARMTTFTFEPLIGLSCQTDINNRSMYYEYDELNKLQLIRDMDGNITKTFDYHYKQQ